MKKPLLLTCPVLLALGVLVTPVSAQELQGKQYLWQTNATGDDVHVIDVATNKVIKRIVVGPQPHGIAAPDEASVVYITIENFKAPLASALVSAS